MIAATASATEPAPARFSRCRTARGPGRRRNAPSRTWYGIAAAAKASSNGSERALIRYSTAISSSGTASS